MADPDPRRDVPRTDAVLADAALAAAMRRLGAETVKAAVRAALDDVRRGVASPDDAVALALARLPAAATTLRPVINATGVVVHTNLGRAPLSDAAVDAVRLAGGYVDLEYDATTGARAGRGRGARAALAERVPVAGDVHVVNNGAAALALTAAALAPAREIVVSRGEMVEIGDGFRLPDLLTSTGARLREVGTTNRVTYDDYAAAVGDDTGFVLKVHPSNFVIRGFTAAVPVAELAELPVPVVVDIGSGLLAPEPMLADEPDATTALRSGAALVTASGDKLLGGPQAGLVLGRADLVARIRRHPLARAVRPDKLTYAALEATLRGPQPPVRVAIAVAAEELKARATAIVDEIVAAGVAAAVVPSVGAVGGGGAPGVELPGWAVALPVGYAVALRTGTPCVVGRVADDRCLLDLRCVPPEHDVDVLKAIVAV